MGARAHKRKPVQKTAWLVDQQGGKLHCCVISDVSEGGARLELPVGIEAPQIFVLSLTPTGSVLRYCEVRWRRGGAIGVRFVSPTDLSRAQKTVPARASAAAGRA